MKKILFGLLWFVAFYLSSCIVVGLIVGGIAMMRDPENAADAGALAGVQVGDAIRVYLALGALALAALGSWKEFLPGTKKKLLPQSPTQNA